MPSCRLPIVLGIALALSACSGDFQGFDQTDETVGGSGGEAARADSDREIDTAGDDDAFRKPEGDGFAPSPPNAVPPPPPPGPPAFNVTLATDPLPTPGFANGCNTLTRLTPGTLRYALVLANQTPGLDTITVTVPGTVELNSNCKTLTFTDDTYFVGRSDFWIKATSMGNADLVRIHGTSSAKAVKAYFMQLWGSTALGAHRRGIRVINGTLGLYYGTIKAMQDPADEGTVGAGVLVKPLAAGEIGSLGVEQTLIEKNRAAGNPGGRGAGLYFAGNGTLVVKDSLFAGNDAYASGGAIQFAAVSAPTAYIMNTTITGNTATLEGGGVGLSSANSAQLRIQNSSISSNYAGSGKGGGIVVEGGANLVMESVTMRENAGAGPYDGTQIHLKAPAAVVLVGTVLSGKTPICGGPSAGQMSGPGNIWSDNSCSLTGIANSSLNVPPLANNGSGCNGPQFPCYTHKLADPSVAVDFSALCLPEDQRHQPRPGPLCWAGSYEQ